MKIFEDSVNKFNFSNVESFKEFLRSSGFDPKELWKSFDEAIVEVILQSSEKVEREIKNQCKSLNCSEENFFELVRFDFIVDRNLKVNENFFLNF